MVVGRAANGLLLLLALDQLLQRLRMLGRDAHVRERLAGCLFGLAGFGALRRRLLLAPAQVARGTCLCRLVAPRVGEADTGDDECGQQSRAEHNDGLAHLPGPPEIELTAQNDREVYTQFFVQSARC